MSKKEARESFNVKDLAHGLYLRDIINCMPDKTKLPYDETTYVGIVHQIIADYNDGLDKDKLGWFCMTKHMLVNVIRQLYLNG